MRRQQAAAGLEEHREDLLAGPRARAQPLLERAALDELHGDEHPLVDLADVVHRDDVRVAQPGHRLGLAQQAGAFDDPRWNDPSKTSAVQIARAWLERHPRDAEESDREKSGP